MGYQNNRRTRKGGKRGSVAPLGAPKRKSRSRSHNKVHPSGIYRSSAKKYQVLPHIPESPSPVRKPGRTLSELNDAYHNLYSDSPKSPNATKELLQVTKAEYIDVDYVKDLVLNGADTSVKHGRQTLVDYLEARRKRCLEKKRGKVAADYLKCKRQLHAIEETIHILNDAPIIRPSEKHLGPIADSTP